jgi:hypothetical protein
MTNEKWKIENLSLVRLHNVAVRLVRWASLPPDRV